MHDYALSFGVLVLVLVFLHTITNLSPFFLYQFDMLSILLKRRGANCVSLYYKRIGLCDKLKPSTSQIEVGRIIRKPTYPQKVLAPKRAHVPEGDEDEPPRKIGPKDLRNVIHKPVIPKRVVVQKVACMIDESTQTDPFIIKRCTIRTSTFEQDGKRVKKNNNIS
jgi:hypothetical protein